MAFKQVNKKIKFITLILTFGLAGCNAGSSWKPGSAGTLSVSINPNTISLNSGGAQNTATVTATLSGATNGTDPNGPATITFYVVNSDGSEPSSIATLSSSTCNIPNTTQSSTVSCSVVLTPANTGNAKIIATAYVPNTTNMSGQNTPSASFTITD